MSSVPVGKGSASHPSNVVKSKAELTKHLQAERERLQGLEEAKQVASLQRGTLFFHPSPIQFTPRIILMPRPHLQSIDAILRKTFEGVGFESYDLDGLHWTPERLKEANFPFGIGRPPPELQEPKTHSSRISRRQSGLSEEAREAACRDVTNSSRNATLRTSTSTSSLPNENHYSTTTLPRSLKRTVSFAHIDFSDPQRNVRHATAVRDEDGWYRAVDVEDISSSPSRASSSFGIAVRSRFSSGTIEDPFASDHRGAADMDEEEALTHAVISGDLDGFVIRDIDEELEAPLSRPVTPIPGQQSPLKERGKEQRQPSDSTDDGQDEDDLDPADMQEISFYGSDDEEDELATPDPYSYFGASRSKAVAIPSQSDTDGASDGAYRTDNFAFDETPESFRRLRMCQSPGYSRIA
ncbi:hypothetical protein VNI00_015772 [Paramarasmius palmivorus]|uniref:Uncharacterized protein n=1 Tax=Paramarasmius palmivorus TaxID=297713 RepID=A0AAW0BIB9_9AGAR